MIIEISVKGSSRLISLQKENHKPVCLKVTKLQCLLALVESLVLQPNSKECTKLNLTKLLGIYFKSIEVS